jgi:hypothetical protein
MIVNAPIPHDNQDITKIWKRAMAARPAEFRPNVPLGDAGEFYEWVVNDLKWPEPAGGFAPREKRKKRWNEERSALFETMFLGVVMCMVCRTVRQRGPWSQSMIELDARTPFTTLEEMLHRKFFSTRRNGHCHTCGVVQRHEVVREITAAPQVSRIRVLITNTDGAQPTKNMTNWIVPESLSLRIRQINCELPLDYSLSSAIAHGGGDYEETGAVSQRDLEFVDRFSDDEEHVNFYEDDEEDENTEDVENVEEDENQDVSSQSENREEKQAEQEHTGRK